MTLLFAQVFGGLAQLLVHGIPIRLLIVDAPEVEATDAVGGEGPSEFDAVREERILLREILGSMKLIALLRLFARGARPVDFVERAGDIGDTQAVLLQNAIGFCDLAGVEVGDVLVPHAAQLDPVEAEVVAATEPAWSKSGEISSLMTERRKGQLEETEARSFEEGRAESAPAAARPPRNRRREASIISPATKQQTPV